MRAPRLVRICWVLVALCGAAGLPVPGASWTGGINSVSETAGACPRGAAYPDGCAGAPIGPMQHPQLFSAPLKPHNSPYPVRPPWNVAGVDYYAGVPANLKLASLEDTGALPACASFNASTGLVWVNATPCNLSAIDFSPQGACVYIPAHAGSDAVSVTNSRFAVGSTSGCKGAYLVSSSREFRGSLFVANNSFFGNGPTTQAMSGAIGSGGSGAVTIQYNYITRIDQHGIDFSAAPSSISEQYNVITDFGMEVGSHPDFTYFCGGEFRNVRIEYNLSAEWFGDGSQPGAELMTLHADRHCGSSLIDPVIQHNVVLAPGTGHRKAETASYALAPIKDQGRTLSGANLSHNFVDWSGAYGPIYPGKGTGFICVGNIDINRGVGIKGRFGNVTCE